MKKYFLSITTFLFVLFIPAALYAPHSQLTRKSLHPLYHSTIKAKVCKSSALQRLKQLSRYTIVEKNRESLHQAIELFSTTPGFYTTLSSFFKQVRYPHTAKGYLYEIERALEIEESEDHDQILAFSHHLGFENTQTREIDLVTTCFCIECKNWQSFNPKKATKLRKQLKAQQKVVKEYNKRYPQTSKQVMLSSKHTIPTSIISWCKRNNIAWHCSTALS